MQEGESQTSFVPIGMLMKNNLSLDSIIAALILARVGIVGLLVLEQQEEDPEKCPVNPVVMH